MYDCLNYCILFFQFDTKYYYAVGIGQTVRKFWFKTPPTVGPDVPYTFGIIGTLSLLCSFSVNWTVKCVIIGLFVKRYVIRLKTYFFSHHVLFLLNSLLKTSCLKLCEGDLGQTYDSNRTLSHYESNPKAETVLYVGDLSYADNYPNHDNNRWDTWGRFVERSTAYQPWIWTAGNHELDFQPSIVSKINLYLITISMLCFQISYTTSSSSTQKSHDNEQTFTCTYR